MNLDNLREGICFGTSISLFFRVIFGVFLLFDEYLTDKLGYITWWHTLIGLPLGSSGNIGQ